MKDGFSDRPDIPVLRCHHCHGEGCVDCGRTGSIFWVCGIVFPYTPEGEKRAIRQYDLEKH